MLQKYRNHLAWSVVAVVLLVLSGCASKPAQGYGVSTSTAAVAQAQFMAAEQSTKDVDTEGAYLGLIAQMQQVGQWYASLAHTDAFEREHGTSSNLQLLRADALRNTQQYEAARKLYASLLATSQASRAYRGIGLMEANQGNFDAAITAFEKARQINPIDAHVLSDMGYAYMRSGQLRQAQLPVMQAAQLAPENPRIQLNLALYWIASGEEALGGQVLQKLQHAKSKAGGALIGQAALESLNEQLNMVRAAVEARSGVVKQEPSEDMMRRVVSVSSHPSDSQPLGTLVAVDMLAQPIGEQR